MARSHIANPKYRSWTTERRRLEAVRLMLVDGWTQRRACAEVGLGRASFIAWCREPDPEALSLSRWQAAELEYGVVVVRSRPQETVRPVVRLSPREFFETYFSWMVCPDCGVHHEIPEFHLEMLEACQTSEDARVLINLPPYHSKSTMVTVIDTIMDLCYDPNSRTIIISKSLDLSKAFVAQIQQLLTDRSLYGDGPNLIDDFGPFRGKNWSTTEFTHAQKTSSEKDPSVLALGVGQQVYGRRADKIKVDDAATLENQRSAKRVLEMLSYFDQEVSTRVGRGKIIYVGTRVHPGDVYSHLRKREGYLILEYPCILSDADRLTLWPEHVPYEMAERIRRDMVEREFQLVYQQMELPGIGAAFTQEALDSCKDAQRPLGAFDGRWVLVAGLDLAGGSKRSGFTAANLRGVDLVTGQRFDIDAWNVKSMRPAELKRMMLEWSDRYPIFEWRVEVNGLQSQIVQYNEELVRELASRGIRVVPHVTGSNKWDADFGVEAMGPLYQAAMVSTPWLGVEAQRVFQEQHRQLLGFPMIPESDLAMATWFSELGCREALQRKALPAFSSRPVPARVARNRRIISPNGVVRYPAVGRVAEPETPEERLTVLGSRRKVASQLLANRRTGRRR